MFGRGSDHGYLPSYYLAEITAVDVEKHTVTIMLLRGQMAYENVMLIRDPGNYNLPKVGDVAVCLWDNRNMPIVIGVYPAYHKNELDTNRNYRVEEGERVVQSEFGQKLLFNKRGEVFLTNWLGQGLAIDQNNGEIALSSDTIKEDTAGVDKKKGFTKRYSNLAFKDTNIFTTTGLDATTTGTTVCVEDSTVISTPDVLGSKIYEQKIGNIVVADDSVIPNEIKTVPVNSNTGLPLRSKTTYYSSSDPTGNMKLDVLVDTEGNVNISIPASAIADGISIEGLLNTLAVNFLNIDLGGSITAAINIGNSIVPTGYQNLITNGILNDLLTLLATHTHPYTDDGNPAITLPSVTLSGVATPGLYHTLVTKAN